MGSKSSKAQYSKPIPLPHFPPEIWEKILLHIDSRKCLTNMSLVSKSMYSLVELKLYAYVHLKDLEILQHIRHLSIQHLNVSCNSHCRAKHAMLISSMPELKKLNLAANRITPNGFPKMKHLPKLTDLNISRCNVEDGSLIEISQIETLQVLNVSSNYAVTSSGLNRISNLRQLQCLYLRNCRAVTDIVLQALIDLPLVQLDISFCSINDRCLSVVSGMVNLRKLNIGKNSSITAVGLHELTKLTYLNELDNSYNLVPTSLDLGNMSNVEILKMAKCKDVTIDIVQTLKQLPALSDLDISQCDLDDACVTALSDITTLDRLNISNSASSLTSLSLANLIKLRNLEKLQMSGCKAATSTVFQNMSKIPLLELDISWCNVDDVILNEVSNIESLKVLNVNGNLKLTSVAMRALSKLPLKHLFAASCDLDNECIKYISEISTLVKLDIMCQINLTSDCLLHLSSLQYLKYLDISWCKNIHSSDLTEIAHVTNIVCKSFW